MIKLLPRPQSFAQLKSWNVYAIVKVFLEDWEIHAQTQFKNLKYIPYNNKNLFY